MRAYRAPRATASRTRRGDPLGETQARSPSARWENLPGGRNARNLGGGPGRGCSPRARRTCPDARSSRGEPPRTDHRGLGQLREIPPRLFVLIGTRRSHPPRVVREPRRARPVRAGGRESRHEREKIRRRSRRRRRPFLAPSPGDRSRGKGVPGRLPEEPTPSRAPAGSVATGGCRSPRTPPRGGRGCRPGSRGPPTVPTRRRPAGGGSLRSA